MKLSTLIFPILLSIFFTSTTFLWFLKNDLPPPWDQAQYLEASEKLYQSITIEGFTSFAVKTVSVLDTKAPLIAILPLPLYLMFGSSILAALSINLIFMLVFYFFFFKLTGLIDNNVRTAIVAIFIISTMPLFYGLSRYFFVEFGLMTITTIWMYLILKSGALLNRKYLFLLGIVTGLGMLMKFHFFLFVGGSGIVSAYRSGRKYGFRFLDLKNLILFALPLIFIASPWYLTNIKMLIWKALRSSNPQILGDLYYGPFYSFSNLYWSALDFVNYVISPYWFIVFIVFGIILLIKKKRKYKVDFFILSWFLIPFLIFYLGPNKDYRLMLPLLPPFTLIVAKMITTLIQKKSFLILFLLVFPTLLSLNTSIFNTKLFRSQISFGPLVLVNREIGNYVKEPKMEKWPIDKMLNFIADLDDKKNKKIILAYEDEKININTLRYYATRSRLPLKINSASYFPDDASSDVVMDTVNDGEYLIMKTGGSRGPVNLNKFNQLILKSLDTDNWSELDHNIELPDGGRLRIFISARL